MGYTTIQEYNVTSGLDRVLSYVSTTLPFFIPMFLLILWLTFTFGIYFGTKRSNPNASALTAATTSSFVILVISTVLSLSPGIMNPIVYGMVAVITIILFLLSLISKER